MNIPDARLLRRFSIRLGLVLLLPSVALAQVRSSQATGSMTWGCGGPIADALIFINLNHVPNGDAKENLTLSFSPAVQNMHPVPAEGFRAVGKGPGERAVKAYIEFEHLSDKKAVGTYHVEFSDGRKEEGAFSVRRHKKFHGGCI